MDEYRENDGNVNEERNRPRKREMELGNAIKY